MRTAIVPLILVLVLVPARGEPSRFRLHEAARKGDLATAKKLLADGADVNARNNFGATPLWYAAYKNQREVLELLLAHKANPNVADGVWASTPLTMAASEDQLECVELLLAAGAQGADGVLIRASAAGKASLIGCLLRKYKPSAEVLGAALTLAKKGEKEVRERLEKAGARPLPAPTEAQRKEYERVVGEYETPSGAKLVLQRRGDVLVGASGVMGIGVLRHLEPGHFRLVGDDSARLQFEMADGKPVRVTAPNGATTITYSPSKARPVRKPGPFTETPALVSTPGNWPSFRGPAATGIADGQHPPATWNLDKPGPNVWKTPIAGLGHSCPVVWGDRLFVTTAVSSDPKSEFRSGQYGAITSAKDRSRHRWKVYCLDRKTGKILWERTPHEGVPQVRRHLKASHANATPATDGKHLVVSFASEGLYCFDLEGKQLWKRDLGIPDAGAFSDPDAQWEAGSSPIVYQNRVIVQCDRQEDSFLAAYDLATGKPMWRTSRDEPPSWGTPTVVECRTGAEIVTNGTNAIRGYDVSTGKQLWSLRRNSQITVPTPFAGEGLIFVTNGYRPIQPIYAVWPGSRGDITLTGREESSDQIAWSKPRGGSYMPTPICYQGHLHVLSNAGQLTCYDARTGKQIYREWIGGDKGFTASPVAADGRLYFTGEDGQVFVVQAGRSFQLLATNDLGDTCLATPAIASGGIYFRTRKYVLGILRP